jgi:hypothetical protein
MKTSNITKTMTLCLLGVGGLSSAANAMQTVVNHGFRHGRVTMHHMHHGIQIRQNHTTINHHEGKEESTWLCPIKDTDIQTLLNAGLKLGNHVQDIRKDVLELHDLLNRTDNICYNTARNWDNHLRHQFHHLHDLQGQIKEQRKTAEAAEEAAMRNVIDAIRSSIHHLGCNLHGTSPKSIQTHSVTQTEDTVTIDLNAKPIEDHDIWETNNFDWKNSNEVSKIIDYLDRVDEHINKEENRKRAEILTLKIESARSRWSPCSLELAEQYPTSKFELNHLSGDALYIADAIEGLMKMPGSDQRNNWEHVENMRCNFEKNAHKLTRKEGTRDHEGFDQLINVVRDLFETYQEEDGLRRKKMCVH